MSNGPNSDTGLTVPDESGNLEGAVVNLVEQIAETPGAVGSVQITINMHQPADIPPKLAPELPAGIFSLL